MTHTYNVTGMTCSSCQKKVHSLLSGVEGVNNVNINLQDGTADINMKKHIPVVRFKAALQNYPKYQISETESIPVTEKFASEDTSPRSWLQTYKPILLIFTYITVISLIASWHDGAIYWMDTMRIFMAGFFLTFSFFKMLDLEGFKDSYAMYDIVAKKITVWGSIYPFIEIFLGLSYALNFHPLETNLVTLVVMIVSIIGVLQSVLNKRKIKCACLGAVFNLPMSTVTIIEDALMIGMSGIMMTVLYAH